jgi:hypothetical protein
MTPMTPNDTPFQHERLDEQLAALAQTDSQSVPTPTSRAYESVRRFHAAQAEQEARALERGRRRLALHAADHRAVQQPGRAATSHSAPIPFPAQSPRRISRLRAVLSTVAAVLVIALLVGGFVALLRPRQIASSPPAGLSGWQVMPSPNSPFPINALKGITVINSHDAWAVGLARKISVNVQPALQVPEVPLVEHWNGTAWQIVSTPTLPYGGGLFDVVSLSSDNVWAVGEVFTAPGDGGYGSFGTALIEHWDGRQWTVAPYNTLPGGSSVLKKLTVLSPDDIWAVGSFADTPTAKPRGLIEHWNGYGWGAFAAPVLPAGEELNSITALATNNIWAAGYSEGSDVHPTQTLIEHWDGTQWSIVPSADTSEPDTIQNDVLTGISAVSANDIWASGVTTSAGHTGPECCYAPLLEHWDGHTWSIVASPTSAMVVLYDILALGPDNVWAVGETWAVKASLATADNGYAQELIEHWGGKRWSAVSNSTPNLHGYTALLAIASDPSTPGKLWVVGTTGPQDRNYDGLSNSTLIETFPSQTGS